MTNANSPASAFVRRATAGDIATGVDHSCRDPCLLQTSQCKLRGPSLNEPCRVDAPRHDERIEPSTRKCAGGRAKVKDLRNLGRYILEAEFAAPKLTHRTPGLPGAEELIVVVQQSRGLRDGVAKVQLGEIRGLHVEGDDGAHDRLFVNEHRHAGYLKCSLLSADWIDETYASAVYVAPEMPLTWMLCAASTSCRRVGMTWL